MHIIKPVEDEPLLPVLLKICDVSRKVTTYNVLPTLVWLIANYLQEYPSLFRDKDIKSFHSVTDVEEYLLENLKEETPYHAPVKKNEPPTNGIFAMDAQRHGNFANEYYCARCPCIKCANRTTDRKAGYCLKLSCNKCKDLARTEKS